MFQALILELLEVPMINNEKRTLIKYILMMHLLQKSELIKYAMNEVNMVSLLVLSNI